MSKGLHDFEPLRRLLALKNHETPPTGFFDDFSHQVIARIRAGEAGAPHGLLKWLSGEMPRLLKSLQTLETKPVFVGAYASMLCLLLVIGVLFAGRPEVTPQISWQATATESAPSFVSVPPMALPQPVNQMLMADTSTNPVFNFPPASSPFGQSQPGVVPVTYSPTGN